MARRGFFAELQHQSRLAQKEREREQRRLEREQAALQRELERAQKADARARVEKAKSDEAERKRQEKDAREAHVEKMEAEAEERNRNLQEIYDEIDSLLESTLGKDDYIDLNDLRSVAKHPPFDREDLEKPLPAPVLAPPQDKPVLKLPEAPRGIAGLFGKGKYQEAVEDAEREHAQAVRDWEARCRKAAADFEAAKQRHANAESDRLERLRVERSRYADECKAREAAVIEQNRRLDNLIANLGYGTVDAVQEYVSIVLSNSIYPEHFPVSHEFTFDPATAELHLRVLIPGPTSIPEIKAYKYAKASDEITSTELPKKQARDRYAGAVHQVAIRSFHEVFEADRRGLIKTISLEVGTNTINPATGLDTYVPFVIAAAQREIFNKFDLSAVVPRMTLDHLGAAISKNPYELVSAERAGVRRA